MVTFDNQNRAIYNFNLQKADILDIDRYLCWGFFSLKPVERDVYFQQMYAALSYDGQRHMVEQHAKLAQSENLDKNKPYISSTEVWTRLGRPS